MNEYTSQPGVSKQYVYIMEQVGSPYCKIGLSSEPVRRLVQLQRKNPNRIALRYVLEPEAGYRAHALEAELHLLLASRRLDGEWFETGAREVLLAALSRLDIAANIERIIEYPQWVIEPESLKLPRRWPTLWNTLPRVKLSLPSADLGLIVLFFLSGFLSLVLLAGIWTGEIQRTVFEAMAYFVLVFASSGGMIAAAFRYSFRHTQERDR